VDETIASSPAARSIAASRTAFVAAIRAGDAKAAASVYSPGAQLLAPATELIRGRDAIEWFWRTGVDAGIFDVELLVEDLRDGAELAFEIGRYGLRLKSSRSETVVDQGRYVLVHERQPGGSWCRVVEMFSPEAPSSMSVGARPVRSGE
jgi:ketosteroid isomerase-like protein